MENIQDIIENKEETTKLNVVSFLEHLNEQTILSRYSH